jgi:hypothetical protein
VKKGRMAMGTGNGKNTQEGKVKANRKKEVEGRGIGDDDEMKKEEPICFCQNFIWQLAGKGAALKEEGMDKWAHCESLAREKRGKKCWKEGKCQKRKKMEGEEWTTGKKFLGALGNW